MNDTLLNPKEVERLKLICELASKEGRHMTIDELVKFLPYRINAKVMKSKLLSSKSFLSGFSITDNLISSRKELHNNEMNHRAKVNLKVARQFAKFCNDRAIKVMAVAGSTSYLSASKDDDVDFFTVVRNNSLWLFLAKAFLTARILRLIRKEYPQLTQSCVMEESYARQAFLTTRDRLYAKDALAASVIKGGSFYATLLTTSKWIITTFPNESSAKITDLTKMQDGPEDCAEFSRVMNFILFFFVGNYVRLKSYILNRKLAKQGRLSAVFMLKIGSDHLIFESTFYRALKNFYSKIV